MRVAIYARVSTNGKNGNGDEQSRRRHRQDTDNQLFHLREWCSKAGHEIVEEYVEQVSGGAGKEKRSEFCARPRTFSQNSDSISFCVGRWIASRAKAWCQRSGTCSGWPRLASASTPTPSRCSRPTTR